MEDIELKPLDGDSARPEGHSNNNNVVNEAGGQVTPGNGNHLGPSAYELKPLLQPAEGAESNGGHVAVNVQSDDSDDSDDSDAQGQKPKVLSRLKEELNKKVFGKLRLWMAILILLIVTISLILLLLFLCSDHQEDADDKYDASLFMLPLAFKGTFRLANSFAQDPVSQPDADNDLIMKLKEKLTDIYTSSHALERYFSLAKISKPSNATLSYELEFKMPEENEQLKRYTLSREVVYHVLQQQLFDQAPEDPLYIEPFSLTMERMDN